MSYGTRNDIFISGTEWLHAGEHNHLEQASDMLRKFWKGMVSGVEGISLKANLEIRLPHVKFLL